jgi:lysophospholipase L1-like esterase
VLRRLDESVFDCAATDLFLMIGINDLNMGHTVDQMEAGYRELLQRIRTSAPRLRVYIQSVLPTGGAHAKQNASVRDFNRRLQKLAAEFGHDYLDLHRLMVDEQGELKAEFTADGLHLKEAAYRIWRDEVIRAMKW